jgi:hypothetical protein
MMPSMKTLARELKLIQTKGVSNLSFPRRRESSGFRLTTLGPRLRGDDAFLLLMSAAITSL